mgnify:CR=1 FL=1
MKQRNNVIAKSAAQTMVPYASRSKVSRAGSKPRSSSQLLSSPRLVIYSGVIFGFILIGIILLHTQLDHLEAKHSKQFGYSNAKSVVSNAQQISNDNYHIEGRGSGSARGAVKCDVDISSLVSYWDDSLSDADRMFRSPFSENPITAADKLNTKPKETRYLSFEPDFGGFNNIRMEFETMVVFAAATGRTLILPPDTSFYLLQRDSKDNHRGFRHFFHRFDDVVDVMSTEDFYKEEVLEKKSYSLPRDEEIRTKLLNSLSKCNLSVRTIKGWQASSKIPCVPLFEHLSEIAAFVPDWHGERHCLIMDDKNWFGDAQTKMTEGIQRFCGTREPVFYNVTMHDAPLLHFRTGAKETRLLSHFYGKFIMHTLPRVKSFFAVTIHIR